MPAAPCHARPRPRVVGTRSRDHTSRLHVASEASPSQRAGPLGAPFADADTPTRLVNQRQELFFAHQARVVLYPEPQLPLRILWAVRQTSCVDTDRDSIFSQGRTGRLPMIVLDAHQHRRRIVRRRHEQRLPECHLRQIIKRRGRGDDSLFECGHRHAIPSVSVINTSGIALRRGVALLLGPTRLFLLLVADFLFRFFREGVNHQEGARDATHLHVDVPRCVAYYGCFWCGRHTYLRLDATHLHWRRCGARGGPKPPPPPSFYYPFSPPPCPAPPAAPPLAVPGQAAPSLPCHA